MASKKTPRNKKTAKYRGKGEQNGKIWYTRYATTKPRRYNQMFLFRKEPEKPNYVKIVAITLSIIAAVAAAGYAAYLYCKKKGICCCICMSPERSKAISSRCICCIPRFVLSGFRVISSFML